MKRISRAGTARIIASFAIALATVDTAAADSAVADVEAAFRQAELHGRQANEQFKRCRRFVEGWLNHADPLTGLIPRNPPNRHLRRESSATSWCSQVPDSLEIETHHERHPAHRVGRIVRSIKPSAPRHTSIPIAMKNAERYGRKIRPACAVRNRLLHW